MVSQDTKPTLADRPPGDDLDSYDTMELGQTGVNMTIKKVDGEPFYNADGSSMTLKVASADSDRFTKASRAARDRRTAVGGRRGGPGAVKAAEIDNDGRDLLVAVVIDWNITFGGNKPEFSPSAVRNLFTQKPFIMRQVDAFIADDANFLKVKPSA